MISIIRLALTLSIILFTFTNCAETDYKITNLDSNQIYQEHTVGNSMNIYSTKINQFKAKNSDLLIDAHLLTKIGIFDTPIVFISKVILITVTQKFRLLYQT